MVIGSNILAVIPGRHYMTQKDKIVIITANYDTDTQSKSPGVNDNGSGVAAIMELARLLKQHKKERCERLILIKQICEVYKQHGLSLTVENVNKKVVQFLDVELNLEKDCYRPYLKENDVPLYVH